MVDPAKGGPMLEEVRDLGRAFGWTPPRPPVGPSDDDASGPESGGGSGEDIWTWLTAGKQKKWWQVWR